MGYSLCIPLMNHHGHNRVHGVESDRVHSEYCPYLNTRTHAFQDYVIDSNWRLRSTVMTPMFVETQGSQGPAESQASPSLAGGARGQLRATQATLEFTQTQAAGGKADIPHDDDTFSHSMPTYFPKK